MTRYERFSKSWKTFTLRFLLFYAVVITSLGCYNGWFGSDSVPRMADDAARGEVGFPAFHFASNYEEANRARLAIFAFQTASFLMDTPNPSPNEVAITTGYHHHLACDDGSAMNVIRQRTSNRAKPDALRVTCKGRVYQMNDVVSTDEVAARASVAIPIGNSQ